MYIYIMKRFLRKYFTHNRPQPLPKLFHQKIYFNYKLSSFGNKNKKLVFYVIKRDVGSGFFSNLFFILYSYLRHSGIVNILDPILSL